MGTENKPKITLFHCIHAFKQTTGPMIKGCVIKAIQMPCSSMTKDVYILKAFEAGADFMQTQCMYNMVRFKEWIKGAADQGLTKKHIYLEM